MRLSYGDPGEIINSTREISRSLVQFAPQGMFIFSCMSRQKFLQADTNRELRPFHSIAPNLGFYGHGEIARINGHVILENCAIVTTAMREGKPTIMPRLPEEPNQSQPTTMPLVQRLANFVAATTAELEEANEKLAKLDTPFIDFESVKGYDDILNISGDGIMGFVSIPNINVELPIYHGTSEGVLQIAAGHIQGSSFPVGGASTHTVISGHRGLPSARLFTDLDQMVEGDTFTINILNEVLTYEVEKILIILPTESDKLAIIPNEDEVTLVTCTPYGVNSHRLLIRGRRIASVYDKKIKVGADALQVDEMKVIPIVFVPLLLLLMIWWKITGRRKKHIRIDKYTIKDLPKMP
jgi:sortase A